jgi:hypothetical protein
MTPPAAVAPGSRCISICAGGSGAASSAERAAYEIFFCFFVCDEAAQMEGERCFFLVAAAAGGGGVLTAQHTHLCDGRDRALQALLRLLLQRQREVEARQRRRRGDAKLGDDQAGRLCVEGVGVVGESEAIVGGVGTPKLIEQSQLRCRDAQ